MWLKFRFNRLSQWIVKRKIFIDKQQYYTMIRERKKISGGIDAVKYLGKKSASSVLKVVLDLAWYLGGACLQEEQDLTV